MTQNQNNIRSVEACKEYGHVPKFYDVAFLYCTVCGKDLEAYTSEDVNEVVKLKTDALLTHLKEEIEKEQERWRKLGETGGTAEKATASGLKQASHLIDSLIHPIQ